MHRLTCRALIVALGATVAVAASSASALATPAQSATADVTSGPFNIRFSAQRPANSPPGAATGDFTAHTALGTVSLFTLHGPITCLDVRGNRLGLFYPITSSTPSLFSMLNGGVFIYLQLDAAGKPQFVGFLPVPFQRTGSCAPGPALLPVTSGTAQFSS